MIYWNLQAVTFHAYLVKGGKQIKEATSADYTLKWTVDVANKKAAWVRFKGKGSLLGTLSHKFSLIVDLGIGQQESFRLRNPRVNPYDVGIIALAFLLNSINNS